MKVHTRKQQPVRHPYIEKKAGVCGGDPVIKGTRIRVSLIAELERGDHSVDEFIASYPHLNHAQVYDALSYYYDHREEIEQAISEETEDYWMKQTAGEGWRK